MFPKKNVFENFEKNLMPWGRRTLESAPDGKAEVHRLSLTKPLAVNLHSHKLIKSSAVCLLNSVTKLEYCCYRSPSFGVSGGGEGKQWSSCLKYRFFKKYENEICARMFQNFSTLP